MGSAFDAAGAKWQADTYIKGKGKEPLRCIHCPATVTHQSAHTRERDDKPILIPAYFRLLPNGRHGYGCKHAVEAKVKTIAKESEDLFESIRDGQYRLRLVMISEGLGGASSSSNKGSGNSSQRTSKTVEHSRSKLPAYINSAKRVLLLRALCDSDDEIAQHLELVFEGNTVVPWSQFYFETERHLDAYNTVLRNTVQYPIALHGTVRSKAPYEGDYGPTNVLNLVKNKYQTNPDDSGNGIGVEVSIWAKDAGWFAGLDIGTEIIILGLWKAKPGAPSPAKWEGKFQTITTNRLSINPILMAQITRVPKKLNGPGSNCFPSLKPP